MRNFTICTAKSGKPAPKRDRRNVFAAKALFANMRYTSTRSAELSAIRTCNP